MQRRTSSHRSQYIFAGTRSSRYRLSRRDDPGTTDRLLGTSAPPLGSWTTRYFTSADKRAIVDDSVCKSGSLSSNNQHHCAVEVRKYTDAVLARSQPDPNRLSSSPWRVRLSKAVEVRSECKPLWLLTRELLTLCTHHCSRHNPLQGGTRPSLQTLDLELSEAEIALKAVSGWS